MAPELIEAISPIAIKNRKVEIVILEEGPGNKARKCWYGPEAIESGQHVFRGAQVFANHPTKTQQTDLPERDVREVIGRIKETYVVREGNKLQLRGILKILEGEEYNWAISLINESIQAQKEGFPPVASVSIHADGDIEKRIMEGEHYNYVKNIKSAVSVDVVTKGGIKNAGFTKFVESLGGNMDRTQERLAQIQKKMADALNGEDQAFLESLREDGGEEEAEELFMTEEGAIVDAEGNEVDPSEVAVVDEEGNEVDPQEAFGGEEDEEIEEPEEDDEQMQFDGEEDEEIEEPEEYIERGDPNDEIPIAELASRFPHVANEINEEEAGVEESDRDLDIVNLKFQNKLLESRLIAERKIIESGLPGGFITVQELLGQSPEDMDRIIESKCLMVENIANLVEAQRPTVVQATESRRAVANVGRKILSESVRPY